MDADRLMVLPVDQIQRNPGQPRKRFDGIEELAASIAENGLLQPITVRPKDGCYQVVAGERRFRAVTLLGWETVAAIVRDVDDATAFQLAILENVARRDMDPIEEARALQQLLDLGMPAGEIERKLGLGEANGATVTWKVSILGCVEQVQWLVSRRQMTVTRAAQMSRLSINGQMKVLALLRERLLTEREFTVLTAELWAQENQREMFQETKLPAEAVDAMERFNRMLEDLAKVSRQMEGFDLLALGQAWAHCAEQKKAEIDDVVRGLNRLKRAFGTESGRRLAAEVGNGGAKQ